MHVSPPAGMGFSQDEGNSAVGYEQVVQAYVNFVTAAGLTQPDVLGWSYGGAIALMLVGLPSLRCAFFSQGRLNSRIVALCAHQFVVRIFIPGSQPDMRPWTLQTACNARHSNTPAQA